MQQLQPLRIKLRSEPGGARDVATGTVEASYKPAAHRIGYPSEDDGDGRGRRLCRQGDRWTAGRHEQGHRPAHQLGGKLRKAIITIVHPAIFYLDVLVLDVSRVSKAAVEGIEPTHRGVR